MSNSSHGWFSAMCAKSSYNNLCSSNALQCACWRVCICVWHHIYGYVLRYVNACIWVVCVQLWLYVYMWACMCKCHLFRMFSSVLRLSIYLTVCSVLTLCVCVCVCTQRHESSLPIMYIEFLFCSLYLSAPIWQTHIIRWSIEERGRAEQGERDGHWRTLGWRVVLVDIFT